MMFRTLRADEIECRVAQCKENGISILLYKDARCDQNILDETVGNMNWERKHSRDNANCTVSIWDSAKNMWVSKEDTGTESNTEKEKGLASDSFKRACFNWGIGRELYTAPFIWIPADKCNISKGRNGNPTCYDRFGVQQIVTIDGRIKSLVIYSETRHQVVYTYGAMAAIPVVEDKNPADKIDIEMWNNLVKAAKEKGVHWRTIINSLGLKNGSEMTVEQYDNALATLKDKETTNE